MKRLHAVAEGHGEVEAIPNLLARILIAHGRGHDWVVNKNVSRLPRSQLVDEAVVGPQRPARHEGIDRAGQRGAVAATRSTPSSGFSPGVSTTCCSPTFVMPRHSISMAVPGTQ